jgi:hypothetical protein
VSFGKATAFGGAAFLWLVFCLFARAARGQGPAPETAAPLFPGGALLSYNSVFETRGPVAGSPGEIPPTARPTFTHEGSFTFTWGFFRDFDLTVVVPIVTNHFQFTPPGGSATFGGTGLGDSMVLVKYRFYRRDSERGTTQASIKFGPKIPTGRTDLAGTGGQLLSAGLQPGSGSIDYFLAGYWTYTGLFNVRRLVADEAFTSLLTTTGTQATRLGDDLESRLWLSYRPFESQNVGREWFIGPDLIWLHSQDDRVAGVTEKGSGGDALLAGVTTYAGLRPGMHVWVAMDWDAIHSTSLLYMPVRRHVSFGITQQFRLRFR